MINLSMWGFEPATGFGPSATDTVGAEPAEDGAGGIPQDLTFGAHLAESLFGVTEGGGEEDTDEDWTPLVPAAFVLTPSMREPVSHAPETAARFSEAVDGQSEFRADGDTPLEAVTNAIQEVPVEAGIPVADKRAPDVPAETQTSAGTEPPPDTPAHAGMGAEFPAPKGPEVRIEQHQAEHSSTEHRPTEHRLTEHREAERHVESMDTLPKRAVERTVVKDMGTPAPQVEAVPAQEIAPGARIESSLPAEDVSPATRMVQPHPSSPDERGPGDRQPAERQDPQLPDLRVQQTTVEPMVEAAKPFVEPHAAQVTAPESAPAVAEPAPRLVLHSAPIQPQAIGADFEIAPESPETRGPMPRETAESIIQSLRLQYQRGGGDAVVHIKPEHLGPVSVSLRVENGSVSAVVNAENPAVAEWLKANEHLLRDGLASNGLHLERFAIKRDGHPHDDGRKGWRPPDERERRRRALKPESTFEITV